LFTRPVGASASGLKPLVPEQHDFYKSAWTILSSDGVLNWGRYSKLFG
jgi:hypothetical protein